MEWNGRVRLTFEWIQGVRGLKRFEGRICTRKRVIESDCLEQGDRLALGWKRGLVLPSDIVGANSPSSGPAGVTGALGLRSLLRRLMRDE